MKTVKQVAEIAGLSVRALHHYDEIGLLRPPMGGNGYRYYGERELLRLQHILFYRELGVSLTEISKILDDPGYDVRAALRDLRTRVAVDLGRRQALADTIERTLRTLEAGRSLDAASLYTGISPEQQQQWEAELEEYYGSGIRATVQEAKQRLASGSPAQWVEFKAELDAVHWAAIELIEQGAAPTSEAAQALIARHHRWVSRSWTPDAESYPKLGEMYLAHADFRAMYDALHPALAGFLADAMQAFAPKLPSAKPTSEASP